MLKKLTVYKFFRVILLVGFLILTLVGCAAVGNRNETPTPDAQLTQIAQQVSGLRGDLQRVEPTLTALVGAVNLQATLLAEQASDVKNLGDIAATAVSAGLQATLAATQATPPALSGSPTLEGNTALLETGNILPLSQQTPLAEVVGVSLDLPTPTPGDQSTDLLFQDDFSSQGGWFVDDNDRFTLSFIDEQYSFAVVTKNSPIWSVKEKTFDDIRVEVDAAQIGGSSDGYYGLVCRFQNRDNYYILVVSPNGNFGIGKMFDKQLRYLNFTNQYGNLLTDKGNRLRADCVGNTLTLYVDGTQVLQATDDSFKSGGAGMVVGNRSSLGTNVRFDNYTVLKPSK